MRTVIVREAQHNSAALLRAPENGEPIKIVLRKTQVTHLPPMPRVSGGSTGWDNHAGRMAKIWGDSMVRHVDETLDGLQ